MVVRALWMLKLSVFLYVCLTPPAGCARASRDLPRLHSGVPFLSHTTFVGVPGERRGAAAKLGEWGMSKDELQGMATHSPMMDTR